MGQAAHQLLVRFSPKSWVSLNRRAMPRILFCAGKICAHNNVRCSPCEIMLCIKICGFYFTGQGSARCRRSRSGLMPFAVIEKVSQQVRLGLIPCLNPPFIPLLPVVRSYFEPVRKGGRALLLRLQCFVKVIKVIVLKVVRLLRSFFCLRFTSAEKLPRRPVLQMLFCAGKSCHECCSVLLYLCS
jgi:hypothetical protein